MWPIVKNECDLAMTVLMCPLGSPGETSHNAVFLRVTPRTAHYHSDHMFIPIFSRHSLAAAIEVCVDNESAELMDQVIGCGPRPTGELATAVLAFEHMKSAER